MSSLFVLLVFVMFLQVISGDGEVVAVMKEGSLFGEVDQACKYNRATHFCVHVCCHMCLCFKVNLIHDVPCGGTVRAKTHCDLLLLSKKNVVQIMQHFPESEGAKNCAILTTLHNSYNHFCLFVFSLYSVH